MPKGGAVPKPASGIAAARCDCASAPGVDVDVAASPFRHGARRAAASAPWRLPTWLLGAALPVATLALAEAAVRLGWIAPNLLPAPSDVAEALTQMVRDGVLAQHIVASTLRVAAGFALGAALAVLLGALVGLSGFAAALLTPSFQALRAIPSLAWVPLLLLWLGIDEASKVALIAIGAFFPVYMGVSAGFRDVDRKLVEVARLRGLGRVALARRVLLPAALPSVLTGLRNGLSLAWMFMVAAELIAASRGLGYLLTDGRETGRADLVMAAIVLLAVLGKLSDGAMAAVERRALRWRDSFGGAT
ncbi:ABC transporter permease [Roseateles aquatilis]|uniref:ABC transporter permease n=2 Tax=Roseateles aquatilis TaxID=431061 RepID=A0A246JED9_9BURK|nr:ABC transporter permease [Roseateles aquatilis]